MSKNISYSDVDHQQNGEKCNHRNEWSNDFLFLSTAVEHGCNGSTFAEDSERVIAYTVWSDEKTLEQFRVTEDYKVRERGGYSIIYGIRFRNSPGDILFQFYCKRILFHELGTSPFT